MPAITPKFGAITVIPQAAFKRLYQSETASNAEVPRDVERLDPKLQESILQRLKGVLPKAQMETPVKLVGGTRKFRDVLVLNNRPINDLDAHSSGDLDAYQHKPTKSVEHFFRLRRAQGAEIQYLPQDLGL